MANRLASETSPYLLQHAHNPVEWYPWGEEALARANREDRPILLSIGYAACHWCHVMERESFEDAATAAIMNAHFVSVKVDREERPDLDSIYMQAVQAMTGQGGWPMTVFLTPAGMPFYGGTYFPPEDRPGMPSFPRVLRTIADAYANRKDDILRTVGSMRTLYDSRSLPETQETRLSSSTLEDAFVALKSQYDARHGGFGTAPKFPASMALEFALAYWARTADATALDMARDTFLHMARGGIYDQIGGGFARYTVDAAWMVPHFEKMLYDNALLIRLGAHLWQATGHAEIRRVTEETIDWAVREMRSPEGGFYSSLDADSEGHEGRFYLWRASELDAHLGPDSALMSKFWGATARGNFEGANILFVPQDRRAVATQGGIEIEQLDAMIAHARATLRDARASRAWPARDEKILAGWNGLMLRAIAEAARIFDRADYRAIAVESGDFVFGALVHDGRAQRSFKDGIARVPGFLEDHAALGLAALAVYELTFDPRWLDRARSLATTTIDAFWDETTGALYDTARDHETLIARPRDLTDNAQPSGTSLAIELLLRIGAIDGDAAPRRHAVLLLDTLAESMARFPLGFGHALTGADLLVHGASELALVGDPDADDFRTLARAATRVFVPSLVLAGGAPMTDGGGPLLSQRPMRDGRATAYLCRDFTCDAPVTDAGPLLEQLRTASFRGSLAQGRS